jgi:hypothetical protein
MLLLCNKWNVPTIFRHMGMLMITEYFQPDGLPLTWKKKTWKNLIETWLLFSMNRILSEEYCSRSNWFKLGFMWKFEWIWIIALRYFCVYLWVFFLLYLLANFNDFLTLLWEKKILVIKKKLLKFEAEGGEFAKILRSLEQFIQTVKGQNNFW